MTSGIFLLLLRFGSPVGWGPGGLFRRRCLAFLFLPRVQLFPGEAQGFLSVELGSGGGGDGVPAALVMALPCGGQPYPDPGDAAPSVQVDVHPGAADGALVEIFSFAGAVPPLFPPLFPPVPPEDVPEGGGQLGIQRLVLLFPPGLAVLVYGDGPGRAGAGVELPERLAAGFGVFAFHPVVFQEEEPGGGLLAWGRGRDGEAGGQDGHSFRAEQEVD